jgi:hypothetical protein
MGEGIAAGRKNHKHLDRSPIDAQVGIPQAAT